MSIQEFLLVFGITLASNLLGSIAGSGISLIQTPVLIALGYPSKEILGVSRLAGWLNSIASFNEFRKKGIIDLKKFAPYILPNFAGLFIGIYLLIIIDPTVLKKMVGWSVLAVIPFLFAKDGIKEIAKSKRVKRASYYVEFIVAIFIAILSSGTDLFLTINHIKLGGLTLLQSSAIKRMIGLVAPVIIFGVMLQQGLTSFYLALPMTLGGLLGGLIGTKIAIYKGNKFVRKVLIVVTLATAIKIIFFG